MIYKIIGFENFAYDDELDCIVKFIGAEQKWLRVKFCHSREHYRRVCIQYQGRKYGGSFEKLKFCAINGLDPKFNTRKWFVTKDGEVITASRLMIENHTKGLKKRGNADSSKNFIMREIQWLEASLKYYNDEPEELLKLLEESKEEFCAIVSKRCNVPFSFAEFCVVEAENDLLLGYDKGTITNPKRWLIKRSIGICVEKMNVTAFRIQDIY